MRDSSLATRLFLSATGWTVIVLIVTGFALSSLYKQAVERSFDRRLNLYMRTLVADVTPPDEGSEKTAQALGEPLFDLPLSGWYWQIVRQDGDKPDKKSSRSLWDRTLPNLAAEGFALSKSGVRIGYVDGPEEQNLRIIERPVDFGPDGKFVVTVAGDAAEIFEETWTFDIYLAGTFLSLTIILLISTIFQVRFGLAPLKRILASLSDIRAGRAEKLEGEFPVEIAPLAREMNALLDANREIVERARTHVGNLAHAVKTPLSVIVNEAAAHGGDPFADKVLEQTNIMRDQVARHLERARMAARLSVVATVTDVDPVVLALRRTMEKIYSNKNIVISASAASGTRFQGERQDLEEMVGNLIDNACKWCQSRVAIEVLDEPASDRIGHQLRIIVDDDGQGLSPAERERVARRGHRLDETKPGSGLGLSIVVDLAALYRGRLTLGTAPIGGVRAELVLPAAEPRVED